MAGAIAGGLGPRFLEMADAAMALTASCFYRVDGQGRAGDYVLRRISPGWLGAYNDTFWRLDPLHPARAGATGRVATLVPGEDGAVAQYRSAFLAPQDTIHQTELYFRRHGRVVAGASMLRSAALGPASPGELTLLDRMVAMVETMLEGEAAPDPGFTRREQEVAALVLKGLPDKSIARTLGIGLPTVKTHVSHILAKTGAPTRTAFMAGMR